MLLGAEGFDPGILGTRDWEYMYPNDQTIRSEKELMGLQPDVREVYQPPDVAAPGLNLTLSPEKGTDTPKPSIVPLLAVGLGALTLFSLK